MTPKNTLFSPAFILNTVPVVMVTGDIDLRITLFKS